METELVISPECRPPSANMAGLSVSLPVSRLVTVHLPDFAPLEAPAHRVELQYLRILAGPLLEENRGSRHRWDSAGSPVLLPSEASLPGNEPGERNWDRPVCPRPDRSPPPFSSPVSESGWDCSPSPTPVLPAARMVARIQVRFFPLSSCRATSDAENARPHHAPASGRSRISFLRRPRQFKNVR